ncbi:MAG TPA: hypothetical protein DCE18_00285 [Syntrophobacteraceae bacterium]|nr:hypothetical protein [Syntrophobacteraceae bacterium]HBZ54511.1 hypothetical protein [Syntrophobacteraceae bacterium]
MRRTDFDCLHIIICFTIIVAHCLLVFCPQPHYHLKNSVLSPGLGLIDEFNRIWFLPLFFLLAGWSSLVSLRSRGIGHFLKERWRRILVPMIAGIALFCPPIKYVELLQGRDLRPSGLRFVEPTQLSFLEFVPRFWTHINQATWSHLWFLAYLFLISVLLLPLLTRLTRIGSLSKSAPLPAMFAYLPFLPLAILVVGLDGWWPFYPTLYRDWANFCYFGAYFLIGAGMAAYPPFELCVQREWPRLGVIGLTASMGMLFAIDTPLGRFLAALATWANCGAILGLARGFLQADGRIFKYLREATLPLYILHNVFVVVLGWYIVHLPLGILAKFCLLTTMTLVTTIAIYHFVLRRLPVLRFLFGMRPFQPATIPKTVEPSGGLPTATESSQPANLRQPISR